MVVSVVDSPQHDSLLLPGEPMGVHLFQPAWQIRPPPAIRCTAVAMDNLE